MRRPRSRPTSPSISRRCPSRMAPTTARPCFWCIGAESGWWCTPQTSSTSTGTTRRRASGIRHAPPKPSVYEGRHLDCGLLMRAEKRACYLRFMSSTVLLMIGRCSVFCFCLIQCKCFRWALCLTRERFWVIRQRGHSRSGEVVAARCLSVNWFHFPQASLGRPNLCRCYSWCTSPSFAALAVSMSSPSQPPYSLPGRQEWSSFSHSTQSFVSSLIRHLVSPEPRARTCLRRFHNQVLYLTPRSVSSTTGT